MHGDINHARTRFEVIKFQVNLCRYYQVGIRYIDSVLNAEALRLNGMWALTSTKPFPAKFPPWSRREIMRLTGPEGDQLARVTVLPTPPLTQVGPW